MACLVCSAAGDAGLLKPARNVSATQQLAKVPLCAPATMRIKPRRHPIPTPPMRQVLGKLCGAIASDESRHEIAYTRIVDEFFR